MKGAKEHAISEIVIENYKIKGQQAKIMQRMLIAIYKEIRKQYMLQTIEMLRQADEETHDDYNPWAQDEERCLKSKNKQDLGEAMLDPQRILPRYGWKKPPISSIGSGRWQIPQLHPHIHKLKEHGNRNKRHRLLNPWPYPAALIEPIYWFWASL